MITVAGTSGEMDKEAYSVFLANYITRNNSAYTKKSSRKSHF